MTAMLKLRRATVLEVTGREGTEQQLLIDLAGEKRNAIADLPLIGSCQAGDEVIVNVQALDLVLGSGGFDVVHVNLTRGLEGEGLPGAHVMKLPYTSLQHAVMPVEGQRLQLPLRRPAAVISLHGQLAALAWSFAQGGPGLKLGYIHTAGGALAGSHSRVARQLREQGLICGYVSAGSAFGGEAEAITTAGALHHGLAELGWDAAVCGPGPGIVGSASALGHGGLQALDSAHAALALGAATMLVARASSADRRERHRGISHHTSTVLELLLAPVTVALPAEGQTELEVRPPTGRLMRHDWRRVAVDIDGYERSGLPAQTMGRGLREDPLFFAAALAAGTVLAELAAVDGGEREADSVR